MMINESEVPRWVWEGLKEKWSKIKSPDDPNISDRCAMCVFMEEFMDDGDCTGICPLDAKWCRADTPDGILGAYQRSYEEWSRNVAAFNRYIDEQLQRTL